MSSKPPIVFTQVGSGAVRANPKRGGTCQLVEIGEQKLLFDCGRSAVHTLAKLGHAAESIDPIFITHLHFDHVCDLAHLILLGWNNGRDRAIRCFGPPGLRHFLDTGIRGAYEQDIASRLGHGKDPSGLNWDVTETAGGSTVLQGAGYRVDTLATEHAGLPNLNYRIDAGDVRVVITSDTEPNPALVDFCAGADLLAVECSGTAGFLASRPWGHWHMNPHTVAQLAGSAGVKRVVLKHLVIEDWTNDPSVSEQMAAEARGQCESAVEVGYDGLRIEVG